MEYTRKIQCIHCRQKLSPKPKDVRIICPGCTLESQMENSIQKYEKSKSCDGRGHSCLWPRKILSKFPVFADSSSSPKMPLTSVPSPLQSLNSPPKKRAVLCGITYTRRKYRLKGTINDVKNMRDMLINNFKFQKDGIVVLTEEEKPEHIPTKKNIERALNWLVQDCKSGDSLVFYFSGHGLRQPDFNDDETDGFDEIICPLDFMKEGMIIDNDINSIIVKPLVKGVTLHAIIDACHSGTILDLKYTYNRDQKKWDVTSTADKATSGGLAICISACADDQVASDTTVFTGSTMNGAMTYSLTKLIRQLAELTYGDLLDRIHEAFEEVNKNDCLANTRFFRRFYKDRLSQKPQLTSSEEFDAYKKHFTL